jgi:hypothetical protein
VQGGAFAQGYGPEELVPGVLTDGLNFNVTTKPGTTWELGGAEGWQEGFYGDGRWSPDLYDHSGFNVFQFDATVDENNEISFDQLVVNPVTLAMFAQTSTPTDDFAQQFRVPDIADNYTVDWVRKVITINEAYLQTVTLTVVLYEFGNGNQFVRSNNSCMPLRDMGDHSEIYLDVTFAEITPPSLSNFYGTASVYVNGVRIPYQGEVAGATEWYTVEPEQNGVNTRLVFNSLYDNDTHYVTFVLNGGTSGVSVPQTQTITINNPYVLTYDLDYFVGDNNVDNVIVEWNGLRLYNTLPNTVVTYSTPLISGYGVPISSTDIPLFNPAGVNVSVAGTPVTTAVYTTNWDPVTLSASGLDGEWNSQYGYLDIGVPINGSSLYVVFEPSYWSGVALGEQVEIVYSATVIGAPYTISVDGDGRGQITLNSALGIAAGDTITVTTFNRDDQQSLVTQAFVALTVTEIVATNTVSGLTTVTTMNVHNLANQDQVTIDTRDSSWTTGAYVRVVSPTEVELYTDYNLTVPLAYNGSYTGSDGYIWRTQDLELDQPEYRLYDTTRLWATLDNILDSTGGFHLDHTILRLYNNVVTGGPSATVIPNVLGVLTEISTTNQLVVLSMAPAANPNALSFRLNVTAAGAGSVWRTNCFTQTYLTETTYSTGRFDDVLHVHDASRLVETHTFTVTPDAQSVFRVGEFAANQVTGIVIVDALDNHITDYAINAAEVAGTEYTTNRNISLDITVQESYTGPLTVTVAVGNKLIVQSEQIQFTSIDLVNNTVTGLLRGRNGTITNTVFEKYSTVQSMLDRDQMSAQDYTVNWYDEYAPLQLNVTPQALFLQQQNP